MILTLIFITALAINLFISNEVGKVAETRELGREKGFWISFILSPILGLLLVLASRPLSQEQVNQIRNQMIITTPEQDKQDQVRQNIIAVIMAVLVVFCVLLITLSN